MFGPSPAPPSPRGGTRITLRVVFAIASFVTCGMLSCLPLFRIAMMRGRWYDWTMAWLSLPVSISCFAVIGALPESDHWTDVALACVLLLGAGSAFYLVIFDIRDLERQRSAAPASYFAPQPGYVMQPPPGAGYGYPPQAPTQVPGSQQTPSGQRRPQQAPTPQQAAYAPHTLNTPHVPHAPPPSYAPPAPYAPSEPPLPAPQPAHRIDQVRAELDELSDLLRNDSDGRRGEGR